MEASAVVEEANKATEGASRNEKPVVVVDVGTEGKATTTATASESQKKKRKNHIRVSNTKKPLLFYLNLAKVPKQYNDIELSALGMAIPTVVIISETLKRNGLAIEKKIATSSFCSMDDEKGRMVQKPQIEIVLEKTEKLDKTTVATA